MIAASLFVLLVVVCVWILFFPDWPEDGRGGQAVVTPDVMS